MIKIRKTTLALAALALLVTGAAANRKHQPTQKSTVLLAGDPTPGCGVFQCDDDNLSSR